MSRVSASSFAALNERFQLHRYLAASQAENVRNRGLRILANRMDDRMSNNAVLKTIRAWREGGAPDVAAITGVLIPGGNRTSTLSIQALGLPGVSNPKDLGLLLEAIELAAPHFRDKAPLQI